MKSNTFPYSLRDQNTETLIQHLPKTTNETVPGSKGKKGTGTRQHLEASIFLSSRQQ